MFDKKLEIFIIFLVFYFNKLCFMKKYIISLIILFIFILSSGISHATILEKKYIVKGLILAKANLIKKSVEGEKYVDAIDIFFRKYWTNSQKMQDVLQKIPSIRKKLWNASQDKTILRIINYIEYKAAYLSIKTPEKPKNPHSRDIQNANTLNKINTLSSIIDTLVSHEDITLKEIVWKKIASRTGTGSQWIIGYPNYSLLWITKDNYQDSFDNEFFIVYHYITDIAYGDQYYYQILGYTQSWDFQKTAIIKWNYSPRNSSYPDSLFIDDVSKNAILDGDIFSIK